MDKQTLIRDMKSRYGSFMSVNDTAEFVGKHRNTVRELLYGLPYLYGRPKRYAITDVADRIMERMTI